MTVAALVAAVAFGGIVLPHLLALQRADPATACLLWAAALGPARARRGREPWPGALVLLHPGHLLRAFAEWPCAPHHQVAGHAVAALGGLALAASLLWALARVAQATLAVRRLVRTPLGRGPEGSVIVGGDDVMLAAAGLARPTLVVSAGALARLDDAELAAAIAHERAHIRRRHRYVLLYAELCRVLGRPLPGHRARGAPAALPHRARRRPLGGARARRPPRAGLGHLQGRDRRHDARRHGRPRRRRHRGARARAAPGRRRRRPAPRPAPARRRGGRPSPWPRRCRCRRSSSGLGDPVVLCGT